MWKSESTLPFQSYCESSIEVDDPPSDQRHTKKQLKFSFLLGIKIISITAACWTEK